MRGTGSGIIYFGKSEVSLDQNYANKPKLKNLILQGAQYAHVWNLHQLLGICVMKLEIENFGIWHLSGAPWSGGLIHHA